MQEEGAAAEGEAEEAAEEKVEADLQLPSSVSEVALQALVRAVDLASYVS